MDQYLFVNVNMLALYTEGMNVRCKIREDEG